MNDQANIVEMLVDKYGVDVHAKALGNTPVSYYIYMSVYLRTYIWML